MENEISTRIGRDINQEKLNTLAYVLGQKGDMEQSGPFIDGYAKAAEMNGITVYGRDGKVFYHTPGTEIPAVDEQLVRMMLEARTTFLENGSGETEVSLYGAYNKLYAENTELFFSTVQREADIQQTYNAYIGDQWMLRTDYTPSENQIYVDNYFKWTKALKSITIGENGFVAAMREQDNQVMSFAADDGLEGQPVESLSVLLPDRDQAASVGDLRKAFEDSEQVLEIKAAGREYLATRLDVPGILMLALLPMEEFREAYTFNTAMLFFLTALISGLYTLYAFFHVDDIPAQETKTEKRLFRNRSLAGRLRVIGILAILFVFTFGLFSDDSFLLLRHVHFHAQEGKHGHLAADGK